MANEDKTGDKIRLRECLEIHLNKGKVLKVAVPQGLDRFIQTSMEGSHVVGTSYHRGTGNGSGSIFYGFYTHLMEERDWDDYRRQHPTEELASGRFSNFSTTYANNDNILRQRLEAMLGKGQWKSKE